MGSVFGEGRAGIADDLSVDEVEGGHLSPGAASAKLLDGVARRAGNDVPGRVEGLLRGDVGIVDAGFQRDVGIDDRFDGGADAEPFGVGDRGRDDLDRVGCGVGREGGLSLCLGDFDVPGFGYVVP